MKSLPIYSEQYINLHRDFEQAVQAKGYSRGKDSCYPIVLREFFFFLENKAIRNIHEVKSTHLLAYYEYLQQRPCQRKEGTISDSAIRQHLLAVRLFFDHLLDTGIISAAPVEIGKQNKNTSTPRNIASKEEIQQICQCCQNKTEKAIIALAYGCGLRRSEIEQLNTRDISFHHGTLTVRKGKFGKSRIIPLSDNVVKDIKEYILYERASLIKNNTEPTHALLINNEGNRMKGLNMNEKIKAIIQRTKNLTLIRKNISLHCFRHSIATHLLDNGANIDFVRQFLGHVQLDTTHLYSKRRKQRQLIQEAAQQAMNNNPNKAQA